MPYININKTIRNLSVEKNISSYAWRPNHIIPVFDYMVTYDAVHPVMYIEN